MYEPGDILAFYGRDWISRAISGFTCGPSHVGLIVRHPTLGPLLVESTTLCELPCDVTGESFNGVQAHLPETRVDRYAGCVTRLRLTPECSLSVDESDLLTRIVMRHWIGRRYDLGGAMLSGSRLIKYLPWWPYPDLGSVFCSALVARLLMRLNRMNWADPARFNPANLVRTLRRSAVYLPEEVIHV